MQFNDLARSIRRNCPAAIFGLLCWSGAAWADEVRVAAGANFIGPMKKIASEFEIKTGHTLAVSFASTGKLYAQIKNGAPFEVFLSADAETPARLEDEGFAVQGTRFPYAFGRLVLWSPKRNYVDERGDVLRTHAFKHLAIANPKLAPYGRAAVEVLTRLQLADAVNPLLVTGEDIAQTYQFVATGNAELGFVAMSQTMVDGQSQGSAWIVPSAYYKPIRQDAVLLKPGENSAGPDAFMRFLKTQPVRAWIRSYGYNLAEGQ